MLCGILFVLHTGIQWEFLPQELGFGSGMTCWRSGTALESGSGCTTRPDLAVRRRSSRRPDQSAAPESIISYAGRNQGEMEIIPMRRLSSSSYAKESTTAISGDLHHYELCQSRNSRPC